MNILKINEDLKLLSDQQLAQSMQAPTGIPQYAIAAELNRRKQVRQQAGPQRQSTVVQDLLTQAPPSPIPMGEAVPQVPPPQPGGGLPYGAAVSPMGMAAGGRVSPYRAADPRRMNWSQIAKLLPGAEWGQRQATGWTPVSRPDAPQMKTQDYVSAIMPILQQQEEKVKQYEDGSLNRALMQAGFAMMASKDPTAFGGIGAGLQQGLSGWTADKAQTRDEMSKLAIQRAAAAAQQQQRAEAEAGRVSDWARSERGADIANAQMENSSRQADANLQWERDKWGEGAEQREATVRATEANTRHSDASAQALADRLGEFKTVEQAYLHGSPQQKADAEKILKMPYQTQMAIQGMMDKRQDKAISAGQGKAMDAERYKVYSQAKQMWVDSMLKKNPQAQFDPKMKDDLWKKAHTEGVKAMEDYDKASASFYVGEDGILRSR
jgi:hypothetical protein